MATARCLCSGNAAPTTIKSPRTWNGRIGKGPAENHIGGSNNETPNVNFIASPRPAELGGGATHGNAFQVYR